MPRRKTQAKSRKPVQRVRPVEQKVAATSAKSSNQRSATFMDRMQNDLDSNKSILNIILGALVVIILGVLVFNFFSKNNPPAITNDLGPAQQTVNTQTNNQTADVAKDQLPGTYTVKDSDTLFSIAQKYYDNGYLYTRLAAANKLADADTITTGQVLQIPKADDPAYTNIAPAPVNGQLASTNQTNQADPAKYGQGGATNQTIWGETINTDTYTVQAGDWLSKIAGRAYGDPMMYTKIAQANNIQDPNVIDPGTVLKIPRG